MHPRFTYLARRAKDGGRITVVALIALAILITPGSTFIEPAQAQTSGCGMDCCADMHEPSSEKSMEPGCTCNMKQSEPPMEVAFDGQLPPQQNQIDLDEVRVLNGIEELVVLSHEYATTSHYPQVHSPPLYLTNSAFLI